MIIFDHLGRKLILNSEPKRIVSLVPSQTELISDLCLEDSLVGVTKFCVHPSHIRQKSLIVGGTKQIHLYKIKQLKPDIILCNKEENTLEMVASLAAIAPVHVSDINTLPDALQLIKDYGLIFNIEDKALKISSRIASEFERLKDKIKYNLPISCLYLIWKDPYMCVGQNTFINEILQVLKFTNVVTKQRYPILSLEEILSKNPSVIFLSSEPYPFKEYHKAIFQKNGIKVVLVNGEYFSWYGSRLLKAVSYFESVLQFSTSE
ncbi:ABC transporter substrate-binding protein [Zunongwangia sp.]|uniref:ABC transporter substrate-binding protein n=1 Tax=Zunongwangia sp. TaxID=1965325 RepID=UPI003AA87387